MTFALCQLSNLVWKSARLITCLNVGALLPTIR